MAYGNWGAWVFRNGVNMPDYEDQTPFKETEYVAGYGQAFGLVGVTDTGEPITVERPSVHHAVLGSGPVRFCGYKSYPVLFVATDDGEIRKIDLAPLARPDYEGQRAGWDDHEFDPAGPGNHVEWPVQGQIMGYRFRCEQVGDYNNMCDLLLIEPDGTRWTARCGYEYGAGHWDDVEPYDATEWSDEWIAAQDWPEAVS
jgi:hypothetical protein